MTLAINNEESQRLTRSLFFPTDDTLQKKANCTACGKQVNQFLRNSVYEHPALKVLICKVEMYNARSRLIFLALTTSTSIPIYICVCNCLNGPCFPLQSCYNYYTSDDINKDSDGMDEQCRYSLIDFID